MLNAKSFVIQILKQNEIKKNKKIPRCEQVSEIQI